MRFDQNTPRNWHVHIGAHKTATTHLQDMMAALQHRMAPDEIRTLVPETVRGRMDPVLTGGLLRYRRGSRFLTRIAGWDLRRRMLPLLGSEPRIVLSEENISGTSDHLLITHRCYPALERRLAALSALFAPGDSVTLYLSIRSFDRVLPGAHATALRFPSPPAPSMQTVRKALRRSPPRWADLVDRIRRQMPQATLRVWRQEDYGHDPAPMLAALYGRPVLPLPDIARPASTLTPSAEGVARAEAAIAAGLTPDRHQTEIEAIYAAYPAGADRARYMPFDAEERDLLRKSYAEDLDRIECAVPGTLIAST